MRDGNQKNVTLSMATGDTFAITLLSDAAMTPWKSGEWLILHAMHAAHRELGIVGAVQHGIEYAEADRGSATGIVLACRLGASQ